LFFYVGRHGAVATYVHVDDVVAALMKCAVEPKAKGRIYNLSSDCLLEDLIKHIASSLGVRLPWLCLPESLIRAAVGLVEGWVRIPLSQPRIDALVSRTRYPADRIVSELGFNFSRPMPTAIEDFAKECT
jgi:nucleoside-diphosphate-sugar epimerase